MSGGRAGRLRCRRVSRGRGRWVSAALGSSLLLPSLLLASEAEHGAAHTASIGELLFPAINFAIFVAIFARYVVPALREYLRRRSTDIAAAAGEARATLAEAEQALAVARSRNGALATESEAVRRDLLAIATRQAERLQAHAEESGKRRLADAALVADQERRRAFEGVRAEIATLATSIAETRIRSTLSDADQRAFVQSFLKDAPSR